jgi:hypothetical protein
LDAWSAPIGPPPPGPAADVGSINELESTRDWALKPAQRCEMKNRRIQGLGLPTPFPAMRYGCALPPSQESCLYERTPLVNGHTQRFW